MAVLAPAAATSISARTAHPAPNLTPRKALTTSVTMHRTRGRMKTREGLAAKMTPASSVTGKRLVSVKTMRPHAAMGPDHHLPDSPIVRWAPISAVTASSGMIHSRSTTVASGASDTRCVAAM